MVEVPDRLMANRVITEAREYGEFDVPGSVGLGEYGEFEAEIDWSLRDLEASECNVDMIDDSVVVTGQIEASYSVKVSRRTRHHPAEYRNETVPLYVSIEMNLDGLDTPQVTGEIV
jgi:hypothetical protein